MLGQQFRTAASVWLVRGGDGEELTTAVPNKQVPKNSASHCKQVASLNLAHDLGLHVRILL